MKTWQEEIRQLICGEKCEHPVQIKLCAKIIEIIDGIAAALEKRMEKAYGGCRKCYGKGYSTQHISVDEISEKNITDPDEVFKPCTCDRGKQFAAVIKKMKAA